MSSTQHHEKSSASQLASRTKNHFLCRTKATRTGGGRLVLMNTKGSVSFEYLVVLLSLGLSVGLVCLGWEQALVEYYQGIVAALHLPIP